MNTTDGLNFIHGIYLTDKLKCENLKATRTLSSMVFATFFLPDIKIDYNTVPLGELKNNADLIFKGFVNPRCGRLIEAAIFEKNNIVDDGTNTDDVSEAKKQQILKIRDAEIEFEKIRRSQVNLPPSRLTCLFLAEDDEDLNSRIALQYILDHKEWQPNIFKFTIIDNWGLQKADYRWFDLYLDQPNPIFIDNYWAGIPVDETPVWEYLLEGRICLSSDEEYNILLEKGHFSTPD